MIPKIIHYCWFGGKEKPEEIQRYITGWKKRLPDYEILEWNEQNFDLTQPLPYVKEAYDAKKFAFVSDYVRIYALYHYGGIYLDTDVEILCRFDRHLEGKTFVTGFESARSLLTAFIAVEQKHPFMKEFLESYQTRRFVMEDGTYDMTPINVGFSALMESHGVNLDENKYQEVGDGIAIHPIAVFCGFDVRNWHVKTTAESCAIHHMNASWVSLRKRLYFRTIYILQKILGYERYDYLKQMIRGK